MKYRFYFFVNYHAELSINENQIRAMELILKQNSGIIRKKCFNA